MAKFCGKCGSKLDEATGLCPNCDADKVKESFVQEKLVEIQESNPKAVQASEETLSKKDAKKKRKADRKAAKKARKKEKRAGWSIGKKIRRFLLKFVLIVLLIGVLAIGVIGVLVDIPFVSGVINTLETIVRPADIDKNMQATDMNGIVYYESSEDNIVTEDGITFINNEILVVLKSDQYKAELDNYLAEIGGHIVGELSDISEYQILLDKEYSHEELSGIADELQSVNWVIYVSLNYAIKIKPDYIPNDSKWGKKWEDVPNGDNWGMEAIEVPSAWDHFDDFHTVNIGIFDDMFDVDHEDLDFVEQPLGNVAANKNISDGRSEWSNHGTHTAGTVSAAFDNKKGVSGVSVKTNLYGVSSKGLEINGYYSSQAWNMAFVYLIVSKNCSVINISLGYDSLTFNASRGCKAALDALDEVSTSISDFLQVLIDNEYQFVICKAAGNQNEVGGGYKYYLKDSFDEETELMYYSHDDYKQFQAGKADDDCKQYFEHHKNDLNTRVSNGGCLDDGNVDAKYDILGAITDKEVNERIIIVGAVENLGFHYEGGFLWFGRTKVHNGYKIADSSQCGERVDVLAPGVDIQSTIRNGYGLMSGTSMAAPHVTGIVGLIFSANEGMTGAAAKKIVKDTAVGTYGRESYGIANAGSSVESALGYIPDENIDKNQEQNNEYDVPTDAVEFNGHWYKVIQDDSVTDWNSALQYCVNRNGYLATITSQEENDFLYSYITQKGCSSAYFGFSDSETEGNWTWCNGEQSSYANWHSGEPNGENPNEDYAMFYYKYSDGTWNDGDFGNKTVNGGSAFICEWGEYEIDPQISEPVRTTSDERDIVLVLDVSGSMSGTPMAETKKASANFIDTILDEDASIGIVTYDDSSYMLSDFSVDKSFLTDAVSSIYGGGGTNIEAGLAEAHAMLNASGAKKKIIVLMSDGEPNEGKEGDALIAYANEIKNDDIIIYTLGFFESLGSYKSSAQILMEGIASDGCHYEVASADDLVFFFEDMADQINGQKYIYIRIACPVDVTVTHNGETLCSAKDDLNLRTDFGTLTFEENVTDADGDDRIKVLRLKEGTDYDVKIIGTGHGIMDYTIGFMDENGDYSDFRRFEDIKITRRTTIDTVATVSKESILNIDENGDGKYDLILRAEENGFGEEVEKSVLVYVAVGGGVLLLLLILIVVVRKNRKNKKAKENN